jgi:hypothetical protein
MIEMSIGKAIFTVAPGPDGERVLLPSVKLSKIIISCLCISLVLSQIACAPKNYNFPSEEARANFGIIAVVPDSSTPAQNFSPEFAKGRLSGAGKGAAAGATGGAAGGAYLAVGCVVCIPFLPLFVAGGAALGGVAGGAIGAINAVPADEAEKMETAINKALADLTVQSKLAEQVLKTGEAMTTYRFILTEGRCSKSADGTLNYDCLKELGIDSVFETTVTSIGFAGGKGGDPAISLVMKADTRLVRISDGAQIYNGSFEDNCRTLRVSVWAADDARLVGEEVENCYKDLSERIIEEAFILVEFPVTTSRQQSCMLSPVYPQWEFGYFKGQPKYVLVDSLQPTFEWESFPRDIDIIGGSNRISNVTYDLKIWNVEDDFPVELIYRRQGLSQSSHKIEEPLMPSSKYFWTVRARFELDNQPRATKCGYSQLPFSSRRGLRVDPCDLNYIPTPNYYRFMTAPEGK